MSDFFALDLTTPPRSWALEDSRSATVAFVSEALGLKRLASVALFFIHLIKSMSDFFALDLTTPPRSWALEDSRSATVAFFLAFLSLALLRAVSPDCSVGPPLLAGFLAPTNDLLNECEESEDCKDFRAISARWILAFCCSRKSDASTSSPSIAVNSAISIFASAISFFRSSTSLATASDSRLA